MQPDDTPGLRWEISATPGSSVLRVVLSGNISPESLKALVLDTLGQAVARGSDRLLSDHTRLVAPITSPDLAGLMAFFEERRARIPFRKWAVVTSSPASYGMMRVLSVRAARLPLDVDVFHTEADAEAWLAQP